MNDPDFEKILQFVAKVHSHQPTECTCGGRLRFHMQSLNLIEGKAWDEIVYKCEDCGQAVKRSHRAAHLDG
jgi:hypothetical protein